MMFGEWNRDLRLGGAAGCVGRVRLIAIPSADSGYGARKSQRGRRRWELLTLIPRRIAVADPIADILNQFEQVDVLDLFDAVGQHHKSSIDLVKLPTLKVVPQLFTTQGQSVTAGVLAQHQPGIGYA